MRKKIVAGNWKMNTLPAEGVELAKQVAAGKHTVCDCVSFIVCPPFTHLSEVSKTLEGTGIAVGPQNSAAQAKGAYTGEVAPSMLAAQIEEVVYNLTPEQFGKLVIAYEPVWAIGTGKTATAEQAQEIHAYIRKVLAAKFGAAAQETAILYGGSCKPSNAAEIFAKEDVDGGLIGGAALKAEDFLAIGKGFSK